MASDVQYKNKTLIINLFNKISKSEQDTIWSISDQMVSCKRLLRKIKYRVIIVFNFDNLCQQLAGHHLEHQQSNGDLLAVGNFVINIFAAEMTYQNFISDTITRLISQQNAGYSDVEAKAVAARLLQHYCGISSYEHLVEPFGVIDPEVIPLLSDAVCELERARPLQYVLGYQYFCGLKVQVGEGVLVPRPETEELVMWVSDFIVTERSGADVKILDAGCGSGCIGLALKSRFVKSRLFSCDLSERALEFTATNFSSHNLSAEVFRCNLLDNPEERIKGVVGSNELLDVIVSNPPYVTLKEREQMRSNVLEHEPKGALFVPDEYPLLFYIALERLARELLVPGGALFLEINEQFGRETATLFDSGYYSDVQLKKDIFGKDRMIRAVKKL